MSTSLINTAVQPFAATAFHNGQFVDVTDADMRDKWSIVFFYPADFTFVCPTEGRVAMWTFDDAAVHRFLVILQRSL